MEQNSTIYNLDTIMNGAVTERFAKAFDEVLGNIFDPNTEATKPRKITLVATIKPNADRDVASFSVEAKPTLVARKPVSTTVLLGCDEDGVIVAKELTKEIPGQIDVEGNETSPKIVPLQNIK